MHQHRLSDIQKLNNRLSEIQSLSESKIQLPFGLMLKFILPQLHNEKATQLQSLYHKLRNNEISRDSFLRLVKNIVGNQILKDAFGKTLNQVSSRNTSVGLESKDKVPPKGHLDQEKPTEEYKTPLSLARKRQKISEIGSDHSIEQLNDFTAFTGINLEEEEEMLFSGAKVGTEVSNSFRRIVEGEQDRILFLQRSHLQEKLARIISNFGIKSIGKDVELCLSMSVEGRMRGLISNLLRMSRQRIDFEKTRHQISVTSDVHHQIVVMNQKDKDLEKQEVEEAEKLRKLKNEHEEWIFDENSETLPDERNSKLESDGGEIRAGGDIDNNVDSPETSKASKAKRMVDDSLLTVAANIATRAFVGGEDLASKWTLMAKKARQTEARFGARVGEKMINMPSKASGNMISYRQESLGAKNRIEGDRQEVRHSISIKDILAVLQREPQSSKSTYIYSLHERLNANTAIV